MGRKILLCYIWIVGSLLLTGCQLMPEEDVLPESPVIHSYEAEEYKIATVMRGDLVINKIVSCTYVPAREEDLSFSLGSIPIDKVYVDEGDQVKAGQILAQLELGNLQEQLTSLNYQLKVLELEKSHVLENMGLDIQKHDIILEDLEWEIAHTEGVRLDELLKAKEEQQQKRAETQKTYADQIQTVEDSIYLQRLRIEEGQEQLRQRQIVAGIDGTVTYVRNASEGQRSVKGQMFFSISDLDTTVFVVKGEDAQYFSVGEEFVITCQNREFETYVGAASEFGISEEEEEDGRVYLQLKQPDPTLKDGTNGTIELILERSQDTLYVDKDAIKTANGENFVYMLDEEGMRMIQKVTTGLKNSDFIEIIDGLQENDNVIID